MNYGGNYASCFAAIGRKLLTLPVVADRYTFLMKTWNTLPESYQERMNKNTLATVKRQIKQAENSMPSMVISVKAARIDNTSFVNYLNSEVGLEDPEIGGTDKNVPIDDNCTDDELHVGRPRVSGDGNDEGDKRGEREAISTASRPQHPASKLQKFDLGTCKVDWNEGKDGDNVDSDAEEEDEASLPDDGSTQNMVS